MVRSACVESVRRAALAVATVTSLQVYLTEGYALVHASPSLDTNALEAAINDTGFDAKMCEGEVKVVKPLSERAVSSQERTDTSHVWSEDASSVSDEREIVTRQFALEGLTCGGCVANVENNVRNRSGVRSVSWLLAYLEKRFTLMLCRRWQ